VSFLQKKEFFSCYTFLSKILKTRTKFQMSLWCEQLDPKLTKKMAQCGLCDEAHLATHYCATCQEFMCQNLADVHPKLKATKSHLLESADRSLELQDNIHRALKDLDKASSDLLVAYADALPPLDVQESMRGNERCFSVFREMIQAGSIMVDQHEALVNLRKSLDTMDHRTMCKVLTHSMFRTDLGLEGFKLGTAHLPTFINGWGSEGSMTGQFNDACDVAFSSTGDVYVCDAGRVQVFDSRGHFARAWNLPQMAEPASLCVAPWGDVYVVDSTRVHRFFQNGALVCTWPLISVSHDRPVDVAASSTEVYVLSSRCMRVFTPDGKFLRAWDVPPKPQGACVGTDEYVYIVFNNRLDVFDSKGNDVASWGGLRHALKVRVIEERVYVAEANGVRVFDMDGSHAKSVGKSTAPRSVAVTADRVYICEASSIEIAKP
jgi:hypothetical protein